MIIIIIIETIRPSIAMRVVSWARKRSARSWISISTRARRPTYIRSSRRWSTTRSRSSSRASRSPNARTFTITCRRSTRTPLSLTLDQILSNSSSKKTFIYLFINRLRGFNDEFIVIIRDKWVVSIRRAAESTRATTCRRYSGTTVVKWSRSTFSRPISACNSTWASSSTTETAGK